MADNTDLNPGAGGDKVVTREISHGGDTAKIQGVFAMGISGNEGSYTAAAIGGDATNGLDVDVTRVGGNVTVVQATASNLNVTAELGATDNAVLDAIAASLATLDNVVAGNEAQVDVVSMPTVTVAGAAAEDAAASGNPVLVGGRYDSSARTLETGDVGALALNASGQLLVEIAAGAGSGGTSAADDADFTDGTTSFTPIGGVYESTPSTVTDGDMGMAGITSDRALKVHVAGITGSQTDDAAFTPASGTVSVIGGIVTADSVDSGDAGAIAMTTARAMHVAVQSIAAGDNNIGNVDVVTLPALAAGTNNIGDVDILSIAAGDNNIGNVDIVTMPNVTLAAGTNTNEVVGDVAHDAAAAGNPVQTGGYATNNIEGVTQVAAGDLTRQVHDLNGVQVMRPHTTLEEIQTVRTTNTDGASTSLIAAAGAGVHNYVTHVTIWNSSSTDGFVDFRDGTAGSVIHTFPAPQTGGCTVAFNPPLKFGDNTAVAYDVSGAISTIYISAIYFQAQG